MNNKPEEQAKKNYYTLRFRSTGLGKTMLEGEPAEVKVVGVCWQCTSNRQPLRAGLSGQPGFATKKYHIR